MYNIRASFLHHHSLYMFRECSWGCELMRDRFFWKNWSKFRFMVFSSAIATVSGVAWTWGTISWLQWFITISSVTSWLLSGGTGKGVLCSMGSNSISSILQDALWLLVGGHCACTGASESMSLEGALGRYGGCEGFRKPVLSVSDPFFLKNQTVMIIPMITNVPSPENRILR